MSLRNLSRMSRGPSKVTKPNALQDENAKRTSLPRKSKAGLGKQTVTLGGNKRKAENEGNSLTKKRSAFGDITNAIGKTFNVGKKDGLKKQPAYGKIKPEDVQFPGFEEEEILALAKNVEETVTVSESSSVEVDSLEVIKEEEEEDENKENLVPQEEYELMRDVPVGIDNYDKTFLDDAFSVAMYAEDIFNYYRKRETKFKIEKYMSSQPNVSRSMRAILVDWMVEVQESFELNHETLYLAVKIVDMYLSKVVIARENLQLLGSTSMFVACKFDERVPPYVDDFLFICDDAYSRDELLAQEQTILKTLCFDLGVPLSYRYLRRYARCSHSTMERLTFARYILEMSLMEYDLIDVSDGIVAAGALVLSSKIQSDGPVWSANLQYYSGYTYEEVKGVAQRMHAMLQQPPRDHIKTIAVKYAHEIFFNVSRIEIPPTIEW